MSIKPLLEILTDLRKVVPQADLGDIARELSVAPRMAAVEKMVQKAPGMDWGWKGGKPGEVTAGELMEVLDSPKPGRLATPKQQDRWNAAANAAEKISARMRDKYGDRIGALSNYGVVKALKFAEDAEIPREYTAKAVSSLGLKLHNFDQLPYNLSVVSDLMRPMTNDQRETFLQLLPRWTGTLETAASAAKKLYRR
jgi:hypothetical protein